MEKKTARQQFVSILKWAGWVVVAQFVLINICASLYAYKLTHFYDKVSYEPYASGNIFTKSWKLFSGPKYAKTPLSDTPAFAISDVEYKTASGLSIRGWYGSPSDSSRGTIIMVHGISVNRSSLVDEALEFYNRNYNILMLDLRAHGSSDGHTTTIGFREAEEVKLAYDWVRAKGEKRIILYGNSMGAVAISRAIFKYGLQPGALILDQPFLSLQTYLKGRAHMLGFPAQPFAFLTTCWIGMERGFNGFRHNTAAYAGSIQCPVLMQWGALDELVKREDTEKIYAAIASNNKRLVIYTSAFHESFLRRDPLKWRLETARFLDNLP